MEAIRRSGLIIPNIETLECVKVKEELTRRSKAYGTSNYIINTFYLETDKFLLIPRYFPITNFFRNIKITDHRDIGQDINITHSIVPRSNSQKKVMEYMLNNNNGIIQLAPGVGKTVISIYNIAERKKKSFILVHRDSLADQWRDRILTFTNLKSSDLARLNSSTFKKDLNKSIIISTVQTFLSLLKRKRKDFLTSLSEANIGIFIADEVHTSVGAPTFSECSIHIPSKCTYGLSATPYRYDGNEDIIKYHLGKVFFDEDLEGTIPAKVTIILLDYKIDIPRRARYIRWGGEFQRSRYLNQLRKSKPFLECIRSLLVSLKNRNLICMSERIKLIDDLYNWLPFKSKSKFCGAAKLEELEKRFTFSTPGKCRDGIDAPWKDCVVMTSPISNIEQLTGRVIRTDVNKEQASIIDLVDYGCRDISQTFYKRKKFYNAKNWKLQYFLFKNKKLQPIEEEVALEILEG